MSTATVALVVLAVAAVVTSAVALAVAYGSVRASARMHAESLAKLERSYRESKDAARRVQSYRSTRSVPQSEVETSVDYMPRGLRPDGSDEGSDW